MKTMYILLVLAILLSGTWIYAGHPEDVKAASVPDREKQIPITGVNGVDISIACELNIRQGDEESLVIEADGDIFHRLEVKVRDSILYIELDDGHKDFDKWDVEIYLTVRTLKLIDIGGAVKVETQGILKTPRLELNISGAADIDMRLDTERLLADFSGAVNAGLEGQAKYVVMDMSGASRVEADDLITEAFYLDFSGFGKADIYTEKVLKVDMSGMGVVRYGGNPDKVNANSSGLGVIKRR